MNTNNIKLVICNFQISLAVANNLNLICKYSNTLSSFFFCS
jgi:hypothetical protein